MQDPRMLLLLSKAAEALAKGDDPFSLKWVEANNVTFAEVKQLTELIAAVLQGFTHVSADMQEKILSQAK